jgi:ribose transport system ATP-binding protein
VLIPDRKRTIAKMPDSAQSVLIQHVSKRFGETVALTDCSLTVRPGDIHAIVGENGSGKSTLAKIVSGVVLPDSGHISVFGETPRNPMQARRLGVATIFQEVLVAGNLTVAENMFAGTDTLWKRSRTVAEARRDSRKILKRLTGAEIDPDTPVRRLPLSVQQWIVIARALLANPRLLILDESSAALDLDATARLHIEINKLRENGCCILVVTHRIAELVKIADRATVLRDGEVVDELVGSTINEANLLNAMSAKRVPGKSTERVVSRLPRSRGGVAMSAKGIRLDYASRPFDFVMNAGEVVGVTGLDGQGQSDFLKIAAGLLEPVAGVVSVLDRNAPDAFKTPSEASDMSITYVSGDRAREGIFPNLSIFENFALPLYRSRFSQLGWIKKRPLQQAFVRETQRLSIRLGHASHLITSLSGGNQQKVLIGRAFATKPKIIVLDDPARGVDIATKQELYVQLRLFAEEGGAVLYLSTEIEEFFDFADRVLVFRNKSLSRTVLSERFSEQELLSAMFGKTHGPGSSADRENVERA